MPHGRTCSSVSRLSPFSVLSQVKLRPAVVLAVAERGDFILCQITSKPYADRAAVELAQGDFETGSLELVSYARPGKLFTANASLTTADIARLRLNAFHQVLEAVIATLRGQRIP